MYRESTTLVTRFFLYGVVCAEVVNRAINGVPFLVEWLSISQLRLYGSWRYPWTNCNHASFEYQPQRFFFLNTTKKLPVPAYSIHVKSVSSSKFECWYTPLYRFDVSDEKESIICILYKNLFLYIYTHRTYFVDVLGQIYYYGYRIT